MYFINKIKTMQQITNINKVTAEILHREIDKALKEISDKYQLQYLKSNTLRYDSAGFKLSIEGKVKTLGENGLTSHAAANSVEARLLLSHGLTMNGLIYVQNETYRIIGYDTKKPKNSIKVVSVKTGKLAGCSVGTAQAATRAYIQRFPAQATQG